MSNPEQVIKLTEEYRAQLAEASDKETIREKQAWFREQAAPLWKK